MQILEHQQPQFRQRSYHLDADQQSHSKMIHVEVAHIHSTPQKDLQSFAYEP